jgi:hypothetical protein
MNRICASLALALLSTGCGFDDVLVDMSSTPVSTMGPDTYRFGATTDGDLWMWEVAFDDVKATPDWTLGTPPPLPVEKAVALAELEVPKYTPTPRAYRLEQVEWLHIGNHMNDQQKWLYVVTFERQYRFEGQEFVGRGTLRIPVLLDGRVIGGRKEPR